MAGVETVVRLVGVLTPFGVFVPLVSTSEWLLVSVVRRVEVRRMLGLVGVDG